MPALRHRPATATALPSAVTLLDVQKAGFEAGVLRERRAGDCPYTHADMELRNAWLAGFSQGRATSDEERASA